MKNKLRHTVIRGYSCEIAKVTRVDRLGSVERVHYVLDHLPDDEWVDSQSADYLTDISFHRLSARQKYTRRPMLLSVMRGNIFFELTHIFISRQREATAVPSAPSVASVLLLAALAPV